jgi:hypothetical protein
MKPLLQQQKQIAGTIKQFIIYSWALIEKTVVWKLRAY